MSIIEEKWSEIQQNLKTEYGISEISYNMWLSNLTIGSFRDNLLTLIVPDEQQQGIDFMRKKYFAFIQTAIAEVTKIMYCDISFIPASQAEYIQPKAVPSPKTPALNMEHSNLNPKYTFDTFVVGSNNRFAYNAALAVADCPGEVYNPLFLYGGVGLGKTHLMHSIGNYIIQQNPDKKVLYVTSEEFTNEVIEAIRTANVNSNSMSRVRDKYRNVDILLLDDVQFIIGKESTQEEFFHTFNVLHGANKQIVLSSDKPPKEIETLEERLQSRFEWGLSADIGLPDFETRMAILRKKEELDGIKLEDDVIQFIAKNVKSNIRELEGALNKIMAKKRLDLSITKIDIPLVEEILQDMIHPDKPKVITIEYIMDVVIEHFNISKADILSTKRAQEISHPRSIIMYLCRELTDKSLKEIGKMLGNKDHTTILHGDKKIRKEVETNESTRNTIEILKKKIIPN